VFRHNHVKCATGSVELLFPFHCWRDSRPLVEKGMGSGARLPLRLPRSLTVVAEGVADEWQTGDDTVLVDRSVIVSFASSDPNAGLFIVCKAGTEVLVAGRDLLRGWESTLEWKLGRIIYREAQRGGYRSVDHTRQCCRSHPFTLLFFFRKNSRHQSRCFRSRVHRALQLQRPHNPSNTHPKSSACIHRMPSHHR